LRNACPSLKVVIGYDGIMAHDAAHFRGCDVMLSCLGEAVRFYAQHGFMSWYLRYGFDERVLEHLAPDAVRSAVGFVGGVSLFDRAHFRRAEVLDAVARNVPVDYWISALPSFFGGFRQAAALARRGHWRSASRTLALMGPLRRLRRLSQGNLYGLEMFQALANSQVVLNVHIDRAVQAANMRLFEATGVGRCLLTDHLPGLDELFVPDAEVVTYRSTAECVEKAKYLLDHPQVCRAVGLAGQRRCLRDYSAVQTILEFEQFLRGML
jgi:hypothetical protein